MWRKCKKGAGWQGVARGVRGAGCPRMRWMDDIQDITGLYLGDLRMAVKDCDNWKKRIMTTTTSQP